MSFILPIVMTRVYWESIMAVSRFLQQSRFHYRRNTSAGLFNDGGIEKSGGSLREENLFENGSLLEGESWKEEQQLQKTLNLSLQTSLKRQEGRKATKRRTRQGTSQKYSQAILASRKFAYQPSNICTSSTLANTPNVTKNILFAEDFIDYLCLRPSVGRNGVEGWRVFNKFWSCKQQVKMEKDMEDLYNLADSTHPTSDYFETPLKAPINYELDNDSADYLSEESLEPSDISSYFV